MQLNNDKGAPDLLNELEDENEDKVVDFKNPNSLKKELSEESVEDDAVEEITVFEEPQF